MTTRMSEIDWDMDMDITREEAIQFIMKSPEWTLDEWAKEKVPKMDKDELIRMCYDIRNCSDEKTLEIEFLDRITKISRKEAIDIVENCGQGEYYIDCIDMFSDGELKECVYGIRNKVIETEIEVNDDNCDDLHILDLIETREYLKPILYKDSYPNEKLLNIKSTLSREEAIQFLKENEKYYQHHEKYDDDALYDIVHHENKYLRRNKSSVKLCLVCLKKSTKCCSKCGVAYYCSAECQKSHWKSHKKVCGLSEREEAIQFLKENDSSFVESKYST